MTRPEHLAWTKQRALEYVDQGELALAVGSLTSDLGKSEDFWQDPLRLDATGMGIVLRGADARELRAWVEEHQWSSPT